MTIMHRSNLRPLPMRIAELQYQALKALRAKDGISVQEHVRRALDLYLYGSKSQVVQPPVTTPAAVNEADIIKRYEAKKYDDATADWMRRIREATGDDRWR